MGVLGDRIGRRRLLFIGAAAFGAASVVAAFAASPGALIASRALLGVAGATVAPSTLSLIRNMFHDPRQRIRRRSASGSTSFSAGAAVGPLAGGLLLEHFWWGSVFLPAVPVMALLLAVGPRLLPEYREPEPGRIDLASVALSLVAVLAVVYGAKTVATHGVASGGVAPVLAGIAAGAAFLDRQRRLAAPMVDLALFRTPGFGPALGANTLAFAVVFGLEVLTAQYLQLVLGLSPLTAGLWGLPVAGAFIVGSQLTAPLAARLEPAPVMLGGLVVALAGAAAARDGRDRRRPGGRRDRGHGPLARAGAGLHARGRRRRGRVAARARGRGGGHLRDELRAGRRARHRAARHDRRRRLPRRDGRRPGEAGETLGGAVVAAERLPAALRPGALEPAREAFTQGLQVAATVSGAIIAAAALLVAGGLRRRGPRAAAALAGASSGC